jgi:hypothetical protein
MLQRRLGRNWQLVKGGVVVFQQAEGCQKHLVGLGGHLGVRTEKSYQLGQLGRVLPRWKPAMLAQQPPQWKEGTRLSHVLLMAGESLTDRPEQRCPWVGQLWTSPQAPPTGKQQHLPPLKLISRTIPQI